MKHTNRRLILPSIGASNSWLRSLLDAAHVKLSPHSMALFDPSTEQKALSALAVGILGLY